MTKTYPSFPRSLAIGVGALATLLAGGCSIELELDHDGANDALTTSGESPILDRTAVNDISPGLTETGGPVFVDISTDRAGFASFGAAGDALPTDGYYSVRRDYRRCASPFCGGYFITALNDVAACPEVAQRAEGNCYVADIEAFYPVQDGDVVHVSSFDPSDENPFLIASVDAVYASVLEDTYSTGSRLVFDEEGTRTVARVNTKFTGTPRRIVASAQDSEELGLIVDAYNENRDLGGALTEGYVLGAQTYVVTNVWAAKQNYCVFLDEEDALTAWNASSLEQAQALAAGNSATITAGFCADLGQVCPEIYQPIFGRIDAAGGECTEFSNNCFFTAAVLRGAGGPGNAGKAKGTYCNPEVAPVCVVADRKTQSTTAWNFENRKAAEGLIASLEQEGAEVVVYDGYCADQLLFCTREYRPVWGTIDALGDVCVDAGNACGFRAEVIAAAGGAENPRKASGSWQAGTCKDEPVECDPTLICGQALTCVDGGLYPTTCGPANCDEPVGECLSQGAGQ